MTQVSLYGGIPDDIQLDDHSDISEDDNQQDEIRKVLEGLGDESFDLSADDSSRNESRSSSVNLNNNKASFLSDKDSSQLSVNGLRMVSGVNGGESYTRNKNAMQNGNGVNLNMLPNSIMDFSENLIYPMSMNGRVDSRNPSPVINGHSKLNGNLVNGNGSSSGSMLPQQSSSSTRPKKQVTIVENSQKNREEEEIEESNPTISLLHKQHCPRQDNGTHVDGEMWLASENKDEQAKMMLELRERQIHRAEDEIQKLQKDKRSLNHQIGLMKTEMVHMKSQQEDADKLNQLKEQECEYLRLKLQETINEYEKVKGGEITARDEVTRLNTEIEKLNQEIVLLSNIGHSTQQTEVNDIVRQLREKHATEFVSWKKVVASLEGELRTYKRKLQLQKEESFTGEADACCQTDDIEIRSQPQPMSPISGEPHKRKEKTQFAILKESEDGDMLIREKKIISMNEKFEELKSQFEEEREQLVTSYENEIEQYRQRLATLPNELYKLWENTQRELGLQAQFDSRPICVDAFTYMEPDDLQRYANEGSAMKQTSAAATNTSRQQANSELQDAEVQVNFESPTANRNREAPTPSDQIEDRPYSVIQVEGKNQASPSGSAMEKSSILVQTDEKEISHAFIQTEETLETYKVLAQLLESWANEVQTAKASEEGSATRCRELETALNTYQKNFKLLQKVATKCRKEGKKREEAHRKQIEEMTARYRELLQKLQEKLDVLT